MRVVSQRAVERVRGELGRVDDRGAHEPLVARLGAVGDRRHVPGLEVAEARGKAVALDVELEVIHRRPVDLELDASQVDGHGLGQALVADDDVSRRVVCDGCREGVGRPLAHAHDVTVDGLVELDGGARGDHLDGVVIGSVERALGARLRDVVERGPGGEHAHVVADGELLLVDQVDAGRQSESHDAPVLGAHVLGLSLTGSPVGPGDDDGALDDRADARLVHAVRDDNAPGLAVLARLAHDHGVAPRLSLLVDVPVRVLLHVEPRPLHVHDLIVRGGGVGLRGLRVRRVLHGLAGELAVLDLDAVLDGYLGLARRGPRACAAHVHAERVSPLGAREGSVRPDGAARLGAHEVSVGLEDEGLSALGGVAVRDRAALGDVLPARVVRAYRVAQELDALRAREVGDHKVATERPRRRVGDAHVVGDDVVHGEGVV